MAMITVGLDISAKTLDAAREGDRRKRSIPNTAEGYAHLKAWLQGLGGPTAVQVGMEATGTYHLPVATALVEAGYTVKVCNPLQVARYSQAMLARTKTDAVDAHTLAQFCARHPELPSWQPPTPERARLQALVRTRADLLEQRQQLENREHAADYTTQGALVQELQAPIRAVLQEQLDHIEEELAQLAQAATPEGQQLRWLQTIPGVRLVTAAVLVA